MDQEKAANPIAEIFDDVFTLMEDLETRSVAIVEYMKEQGGVSDEKLAPYLDRAAAASDVRWRAARARMEHLLAPKPKSATEVGKDEKTKDASRSQAQSKRARGGATRQSRKATNRELRLIPKISGKNSLWRNLAGPIRPNRRTGIRRTRNRLRTRSPTRKRPRKVGKAKKQTPRQRLRPSAEEKTQTLQEVTMPRTGHRNLPAKSPPDCHPMKKNNRPKKLRSNFRQRFIQTTICK